MTQEIDYALRQTLGLAGVIQAARLVDDVAQKGMVDQDAFATSLSSILITQPETTLDIYGGEPHHLRLGARALRQIANRDLEHNQATLTYASGLLVLHAKLKKNPAMLSAIGQRLEVIQSQAQHFSPTHENVIAALAGLYQDTLSTLSYRIQVKGDPQLLQQQGNADKIRALLLAGIRSAMLWSQSGGQRWRLLFSRKKILGDLDRLGL
ncbi:high frequency lysogenization protein HflD [Marinospirillum sp.]|uniref:high frequency lysogenization protein HflD n=1 Tax=Marinospirillum sp. TaxID=2183934 RepID=UPI003A84F9D3